MNRRTAVVIMLALVTCGLPGPAFSSPYLSLNGGYLWTSDADVAMDDGTTGWYSYDDGYMMDLAAGQSFANGMRLELEIPYRFNDIDTFSPQQLSNLEYDREISSLALMVNLYYDYDTRTAWTPFFGAGIGYALMQIEGQSTHHDDGVYAYQLMGGCGYAFKEHISIDLQYRYYATENPQFPGIETEYLTQSIMLGVRYLY